jgi:hypothetical protein
MIGNMAFYYLDKDEILFGKVFHYQQNLIINRSISLFVLITIF